MTGTHATNKQRHAKRGSMGGKQSPRQAFNNVANFIPASITSSSDKETTGEDDTIKGKKLRKNSMCETQDY